MKPRFVSTNRGFAFPSRLRAVMYHADRGVVLALCILIGLCSIGSALPAQAQTSDAAGSDERARLHFRAGESHYEAGRFQQAAEEFEASYALRPHPELQHNIYLAHRDAGNRTEAAAALRRYLDESEEVPNRALLEARLEALESDDSDPDESEPDETPQTAEAPSMLPGAVLIGTGAALGVVAVVTGVGALDAEDRLHERCPTRVGCDPADESIEDEARRMALATDVIWPIAAAVAAVGVVLMIRAVIGRNVDVEVACGGTGCAGRVGGRF